MKKLVIGERHYALPNGIERPAENALEALVGARRILEEEGRWAQGAWYENMHQDINPEDPFCNNWQVCAEGAIGLMIWGATHDHVLHIWTVCSGPMNASGNHGHDAPPTPEELVIYEKAKNIFCDAANQLTGASANSAHEFNDEIAQTRTEILSYFDKAIEIATNKENNDG